MQAGDPADPPDREVFRDTIVWAKDHSPAGKAEGHCTVIEASTTTEGVGIFVPGATSIAAITGGTGAYEGAKGHATFLFNPAAHSPVTFVLSRR